MIKQLKHRLLRDLKKQQERFRTIAVYTNKRIEYMTQIKQTDKVLAEFNELFGILSSLKYAVENIDRAIKYLEVL